MASDELINPWQTTVLQPSAGQGPFFTRLSTADIPHSRFSQPDLYNNIAPDLARFGRGINLNYPQPQIQQLPHVFDRSKLGMPQIFDDIMRVLRGR